MDFRTIVDTPRYGFRIEPQEQMLFVGSCFADSIGRRFVEEKFRATVNPFGVMYNPASILHTVEKWGEAPRIALFTLGTNHVYRLRETGEIVDNCQKRPQNLFNEEELTVEECHDYLSQAAKLLAERNAEAHIILTVSPIRYAKYGYHGSQLSKATLLLAAEKLVRSNPRCAYFPAYEIVNDELRDYRFYREDMLHPSQQAVEYIYERFAEATFSPAARRFVQEWKPIKEALAHRPFNPGSDAYKEFARRTQIQLAALRAKYPNMPL